MDMLCEKTTKWTHYDEVKGGGVDVRRSEHVNKAGKYWVRAVGTFHTIEEAQDLIDIVAITSNRPIWEAINICYDVVAKVDDNTDIVYTQTKGWGGIVSARDWVNLRRSDTLADGSYCTLGTPTTHKAKLKSPTGFVRGETHLSGWKICKVDSGVECIYIAGADPKGWILNSLLRQGVRAAALEFFTRVDDHFKQKNAC
eukprot:TRINITY_DN17963_c0_g1_i1.p1 TRINITY_DN17963_c0_g1~~TRINITY_DN17963_c0_g1_i1.p1  ORF type:complete len:223 (-),score=26.94 TRINITY_DN17963_c0_g1_i1:115-711(-)